MLRLFIYFNTKSQRWVMGLILKMLKIFFIQGWSGSHLLKKLGWGLPDSGGLVSGSGCCASHLYGTSSGWGLQNNCRFPWSVCWCSCGCSWVVVWVLPGEDLWCSWGYICADRHVWLDCVWMTFMDVIMCTLVLASTNDLNQV